MPFVKHVFSFCRILFVLSKIDFVLVKILLEIYIFIQFVTMEISVGKKKYKRDDKIKKFYTQLNYQISNSVIL